MPPIVKIFLISVFIIFLIFAYFHEKRREEALKTWARSRRFHTEPSNTIYMSQVYPGIQLFAKGHSAIVKNIFRGNYFEHGVFLAEYCFTTPNGGKNTTRNPMGVVILTCDFPTIPLLIRREKVLDKVGGSFGGEEIHFESSEFSDKFLVKCSDEKWANDIVHSGTVDYLLGAPKFNVEFGLQEIAVYKCGNFDIASYEQALEMALKMRELIPGYVIDQMKGSPS